MFKPHFDKNALTRPIDNYSLEIINVKLNPLSDEEIRAIVEIEMHPAVRRWLIDYASDDFDMELKEYREFFHNLGGNDRVEVLAAKLNGRIVGFLALWRIDEHDSYTRSIGVSVHPECWGRGIATALIKESIKIARELGVKKLVIETLAENSAMRRVAEKLGFKLEAVRKLFKGGLSYDEYVYSLQL